MNEEKFVKFCKQTVADYANRHGKNLPYIVTEDNVYVVWLCKTLQNSKALVSTTLPDGMYYEITYNGDKREAYLDAYEKRDNLCIIL